MTGFPDYGEWHVSRNLFGSDAPFAELHVNFVAWTGSIRDRSRQERLDKIRPLGTDGFWSAYKIGAHQGRFEAIFESESSLILRFTTGSVHGEYRARGTDIRWGGRKQPSFRIVSMSAADRVGEAINRALPLLPAEIRQQVAQLITPEALSIIAGTMAIWAVSHFFGVGEIADVILIITGAVLLGAAATDVARHLVEFARLSLGGESEQDLDEAGQHFAAAVTAAGIDVIMAVLLRRYRKSDKKPFRDLHEGTQPWNPRTHRPLHTSPGRWFYSIRKGSPQPGARGATSPEGDIWVSNRAGDFPRDSTFALERLKTFRHESAHSFLTPKLQVLRDVRVQLRQGAYSRSYIMRYLEEALVEAYGRYGTIGDMPKAIKFPVRNGYVTLAKMREEAKGILQGSVVVGGVIFRVFFSDDPSITGVGYYYDEWSAVLQ